MEEGEGGRRWDGKVREIGEIVNVVEGKSEEIGDSFKQQLAKAYLQVPQQPNNIAELLTSKPQ